MTDGFSIRQMTSSLPVYPQFAVPLTETKKQILQHDLAQPFHYLGKGCQFYAFESEDGKYVLKFLKHKHLRPRTWLRSLPLPKGLQKKCAASISRRQKRVLDLFSSCKLAYEQMADETGLLFIHLARIPQLGMTVEIFDKLGCKHEIALDEYEYVIQKRALSVQEVFAAIQSEKELKERIEQLIAVVVARCEKGIADRDRSFVQNVAFCVDEPKALFIDTGQFYEDPDVLTAEGQRADLQKRLGNLRFWTERHFPHCLPVVDQYIQPVCR